MSQAPAEARGLKDHPFVRWLTGAVLIGGYLRLIKATSRVVYDPPDCWEKAQADWPVIAVSWHGQSNLAYACIPDTSNLALLISNHPDGQMAAAMARSFGYKTIEAAGASDAKSQATGGLAAFRAMLKALRDGTTLFATADIPPIPGRNVSLGMIALARRSGRPVFAIATASSRRKVMERVWDRMQMNYPFSTIAFVAEGPFWMTDAGRTDEEYAGELKAALDRVLERSFAIADGRVRV